MSFLQQVWEILQSARKVPGIVGLMSSVIVALSPLERMPWLALISGLWAGILFAFPGFRAVIAFPICVQILSATQWEHLCRYSHAHMG